MALELAYIYAELICYWLIQYHSADLENNNENAKWIGDMHRDQINKALQCLELEKTYRYTIYLYNISE